ncbi:hypothetical protein AB0M46_02265 [Dactylosporangium sp. NPDC051485]|uniref:hypothetical protein n=1 Tax=Dactylosporangium sp. NPDC051485 TaxID=3154846 RepID=UPI00343B3D1B
MAERSQCLSELGLVFDRYGEVAVSDERAQGAQFPVVGDEGGERRVGAFDEADDAPGRGFLPCR